MARTTKDNVDKDIETLQRIKESIFTGVFYSSNLEDTMDSLTKALCGDNKNNYILAARVFDYMALFVRARMAEMDSHLSQFTVKVVELAKKKGWYEEPKQVPAPAPAANTEAAKAPSPVPTKATTKKAKK